MKKLLIITLIALTMPITNLLAAPVNGYTCEFEDTTANNQWVLNAGPFGPDCTNKWYIGEAANNGGNGGMYISHDGGLTPGYLSGDGNAQSVSAYVPIQLIAGNYELSFDWQAMGMDQDGLYVCWVPETVFSNSTNQTNALPQYVTTYGVRVGGRTKLNNSRWNSIFGTFRADGTPHKLVFVWNNGTTGAISPAACIDNVNIIPLASCSHPYDIELTPNGSQVDITWSGMATSYDVRIKSQVTGEWTEWFNYTSQTIVITDLPEGPVEIYVRTNCDEFNSVWVSAEKLLYYPDRRCIDFLDINAQNCYFGTNKNPEANQGIVNNGYTDASSQHTIHYDSLETDPRTANGLMTVSPYDVASVRLGNWLSNSQAESIIYDYTVGTDAETGVLLLHYAVVLQVPNHAIERQPRFTLEVLDSKGRPVGVCTSLDFAAGFGTGSDEGWHELGTGDEKLAWKDWTTVGVNLMDYAGQNMKIRLSTYDCADGAHFGYAYFALSCESGHISKTGCGDSENSVFTAPDGFRYRWYKKNNPSLVLSQDQTLNIPKGDVDTFCVDLIQMVDEDCYYTLYASNVPLYPVAVGSYTSKIENCETVVTFTGSGTVIEKTVSGAAVPSDTPCDSIRWDFGDGTYSTEDEHTHIFPPEGGNYTVTLTAYLAECDSIITFQLNIPPSTTPRDSVIVHICQGESFEYDGVDYFIDSEFHDTIVGGASTGCDSIFTTILDVIELTDSTLSDTTCTANLPYNFYGQSITAAGNYEHIELSTHGCDSLKITLTLIVNESLEIDIPDFASNCGLSDTATVLHIPYTVTSGAFYSYDIRFTTPDRPSLNIIGVDPAGKGYLEIPLIEEMSPNYYTISVLFENDICGSIEKEIALDILYDSALVAQRWNDVLGVKNKDYNGGYDFVSYQWFKDGAPLPGEVEPIYYIEGGLDTKAEYSVMLTRVDGSMVRTCPMIPAYYDIADAPASVTFDNHTTKVIIKAPASGVVNVWNTSGQLLSTSTINKGETIIKAPEQSGIYIVEIVEEDGTRTAEKIVVTNK